MPLPPRHQLRPSPLLHSLAVLLVIQSLRPTPTSQRPVPMLQNLVVALHLVPALQIWLVTEGLEATVALLLDPQVAQVVLLQPPVVLVVLDPRPTEHPRHLPHLSQPSTPVPPILSQLLSWVLLLSLSSLYKFSIISPNR